MSTVLLTIHEDNPEPRSIRQAANSLTEGGIVLVPTETGYCFVGDAREESTHKKFLALRPAHSPKKPFSLLCKDISQASNCAILTTAVYRVATRLLPGPYTFILEASRSTPKIASGPKRKTVGIRISSHPVVRDLMECFGEPVLITSVTDAEELYDTEYFEDGNDQSDAWWTSAIEIAARFPNEIDVALVCEGPIPMRVSTVIDFTQQPPTILRDGGWGDVIGVRG